MSSRVSLNAGSQSSGTTSFRAEVSARSEAYVRTNGPACSSNDFQYGSVAKTSTPSSDATASQSRTP